MFLLVQSNSLSMDLPTMTVSLSVVATDSPTEQVLISFWHSQVACPSPYTMAEEMCSPEYQPALWEEWRERLNGWSGGLDTYQEIYDEVRTIDANTLPENVEPCRWWKG